MKRLPLAVRIARSTRAPSQVVMTESGQLLFGANAGGLGNRQIRRMAAQMAKRKGVKNEF
jgi:hypothetical protein